MQTYQHAYLIRMEEIGIQQSGEHTCLNRELFVMSGKEISVEGKGKFT